MQAKKFANLSIEGKTNTQTAEKRPKADYDS